MKSFKIKISNVQHIKELDFSIDLEDYGIVSIIGKNGVGKTTLFKAIQNLLRTNTFIKTSHPYIFKEDSKISYLTDRFEFEFTYDPKINSINFYNEIDSSVKKNIYVELPIPFGERFNQYKGVGTEKKEIHKKILLHKYTIPDELIKLLNYIYNTDRFNDLIEIRLDNSDICYVLVYDDKPYIREDYFSSSEYFIIAIYKLIKTKCKLIAIDEIDISLDTNAQVRLVKCLRELSKENFIKVFFSTHSLALIKTLESKELYFMDMNDEGICTFEETTHFEMQERLYGFTDYKKERDFLAERIEEASKPLIVTEGKTDWKHFKSALKRFNSVDEYSELDFDFLEYEDNIEMGDSQLNLMIKSFEKVGSTKKIIFIFDRDSEKILKDYDNGSEFNNHGNNVYSFCIPSLSKELDKICIEYCYSEENLKTYDSERRRLFLGKEFYPNGNSICGSYQTIEKNKCDKLTIIDNRVFRSTDLSHGNSVALSKNDFAEYIYTEKEGFNSFNIDNFRPTFNIIKKILEE